MAVHKRTTMLAHCNLKQNTWLWSKQSSFFPFMHCPLVANRKTRWSIECPSRPLFPLHGTYSNSHFHWEDNEVTTMPLRVGVCTSLWDLIKRKIEPNPSSIRLSVCCCCGCVALSRKWEFDPIFNLKTGAGLASAFRKAGSNFGQKHVRSIAEK